MVGFGIGLEGIDRGSQRLQHVGLDHGGRTEKAGRNARKQLALGQAVLDQARIDIDRARQCDAFDGQFLVVDAISRKAGEQHSDKGDETGDKTQSNHSLTRSEVLA